MRWFYQDNITSKSVWEKPEGCDFELPREAPPNAVRHSELPEGWKTAWDANSKNLYFFNGKETVWRRPEGQPAAVQPQQSVEDQQRQQQAAAAAAAAAAASQMASKVDNDAVSQPPGAPVSPTKERGNGAAYSPTAGRDAGVNWEPGWCGKKKKWYFKNPATGKTTWERPAGCTLVFPSDPPPVPPGFSAAWSPAKERFWYFDVATHKTVGWNLPASTATPTNSAEPSKALPAAQGLPSNEQMAVTPGGTVQQDAQRPQEVAAPKSDGSAALPPGWEEAWDENHKRTYYFNRQLQKVDWKMPVAAEGAPQSAAQSQPQAAGQAQGTGDLPPGWAKEWSETQNRYYYFNRAMNNKTQWDPPLWPVDNTARRLDMGETGAMPGEAQRVMAPSAPSPASIGTKAPSSNPLPAPCGPAPGQEMPAQSPIKSPPKMPESPSKRGNEQMSTEQLDRFQLNLLLQRVKIDSPGLIQVVDHFWSLQTSNTVTFNAFWEFLSQEQQGQQAQPT